MYTALTPEKAKIFELKVYMEQYENLHGIAVFLSKYDAAKLIDFVSSGRIRLKITL